ncbi:MAG: hypothetical protein ACK5O7_05300 [Holosporales bacterium]
MIFFIRFLVIFCVLGRVVCPLYGSDIPDNEQQDCYILYRGFHFLEGQEIPDGIMKERGIKARALAEGDIAETEFSQVRSKIQGLDRPWTVEERNTFQPTTQSPLQELVQCYTNTYASFIAQLGEEKSLVRRLLQSVGLEKVTSNFFLSTSLKASQAYAYGAGMKLYGEQDKRRYPKYVSKSKNTSFEATNPLLGYVDVIRVPKAFIEETGAFFVVDSFAIGATKLSYHFSKNLTEEREVLFPFYIAKKFHLTRLPIQAPTISSFGSRYSLQHTHWYRGLRDAETKAQKKDQETKLLKSLLKKRAARVESKVDEALLKKAMKRLFHAPFMAGLGRAILPKEASEVRQKIMEYVEKIYAQNKNKQTYKVALRKITFHISHAIKHVARSNHPLMLEARFSMRTINTEVLGLMGLFLDENAITHISFKGDPMIAPDLLEQFRTIDFHDDQAVAAMEDLWFDPNPQLIDHLGQLTRKRQVALTLDVTGLGLAPCYFEALQDKPQLSLVDKGREELTKAYTYVIDGADWLGEYMRKALVLH